MGPPVLHSVKRLLWQKLAKQTIRFTDSFQACPPTAAVELTLDSVMLSAAQLFNLARKVEELM